MGIKEGGYVRRNFLFLCIYLSLYLYPPTYLPTHSSLHVLTAYLPTCLEPWQSHGWCTCLLAAIIPSNPLWCRDFFCSLGFHVNPAYPEYQEMSRKIKTGDIILTTFIPNYLSFYLPTYLPTYPLTHLSTYLPLFLPS